GVKAVGRQASVTYVHVANLDVKEGPGHNTTGVQGTFADTTIDAGPGGGTVTAGADDQDLDNLLGKLTVHGSDARNVKLIVTDQRHPASVPENFLVTGTNLTRSFLGDPAPFPRDHPVTIEYSGLSNLDLTPSGSTINYVTVTGDVGMDVKVNG